MAVAFDNVASTSGVAVTTLTTPAFTVGSAANRAVELQFAASADTVGITASLGTDPNMTIVAGTNGGATTGTVILSRITALTGSQTATASWTTSQDVSIGAITASGVNQTTTMDGGQNGAVTTLTITSVNGDLTTSDIISTTAQTTNQTQRWAEAPGINFSKGDTGPGTGTTTHTWTGVTNPGMSGANFVAVAAGKVAPRLLALLGVGAG